MIPWDRQLSKRHMKRGYINLQEGSKRFQRYSKGIAPTIQYQRHKHNLRTTHLTSHTTKTNQPPPLTPQSSPLPILSKHKRSRNQKTPNSEKEFLVLFS